MCAFIGPNLDEMVVTSAREHLTPEQLAREPYAGGLFRLNPGVRGVPRPCVVH
jgi:sugar lactone lactonase YvrE